MKRKFFKLTTLFFLVLLALAILPSQITKAQANCIFDDVCDNHIFYEPIRILKERNIVRGYSDNTFRPDQNITRGEIAVIIYKAFEYTPRTDCGNFNDIPSNHPAYVQITTLKCNNVINGYPGNFFRPDEFTTRGQLAKFTTNGANMAYNIGCGNFADVPSSYTFYLEVTTLKCNGIVGGYGTSNQFRPDENVSRAQAAKFIANSLDYRLENADLCAIMRAIPAMTNQEFVGYARRNKDFAYCAKGLKLPYALSLQNNVKVDEALRYRLPTDPEAPVRMNAGCNYSLRADIEDCIRTFPDFDKQGAVHGAADYIQTDGIVMDIKSASRVSYISPIYIPGGVPSLSSFSVNTTIRGIDYKLYYTHVDPNSYQEFYNQYRNNPGAVQYGTRMGYVYSDRNDIWHTSDGGESVRGYCRYRTDSAASNLRRYTFGDTTGQKIACYASHIDFVVRNMDNRILDPYAICPGTDNLQPYCRAYYYPNNWYYNPPRDANVDYTKFLWEGDPYDTDGNIILHSDESN